MSEGSEEGAQGFRGGGLPHQGVFGANEAYEVGGVGANYPQKGWNVAHTPPGI